MEKLLLITFRQSLEQDLADVLHKLEIKTYTIIPGVLGMGETGSVPSTFGWPGVNSILLLVLNEQQEKLVLEEFKAFRNRLAEKQSSSKIPLRIFVLPCDQVI